MEAQNPTTTSLPAEKSASGSRKRRRPALACESCRARKIKCDRNTPCNKCVRSKKARSCTYVPESNLSAAASPTPPRQRASPQPTNRPQSGIQGTPLAQLPEVQEKVAVQASPAATCQPTPLLVNDADQPPVTTHIKGKLYGASHWTNPIENLPNMLRFDRLDLAQNPQLRTLMAKCKKYARDAKRHPPVYEAKSSELREKVPPRHVADRLFEYYLDTFETVFSIHDIGSLKDEYADFWSKPAAAKDAFIVRLLLILALGTCFYDDHDLHASSVHWVIAAHAWAYSPFAKARVTLDGVQVQCLLVLARQTHSVGGDMIWISTGNLVRTAMQLGLNRDPSHFQNISPREAEVRRKVWATTVELSVQSCIDSGQPPLISPDDYDCSPPSDHPKTAQQALLASLPTRLHIAKFLNHFRSDLSYTTALSLSAALTKSLRTHTTPSPTFPHRLSAFLTYRFLIALHQPFAARAKTSPTFYFSRKMCVDASLLVLSSTSPSDPSDPYPHLMALGNGLFHSTLLQAAVCILLELLWHAADDDDAAALVTQASVAARREQEEAIRCYAGHLRERMRKGQGNFKVFVLVSLAVAQLERGGSGMGSAEQVEGVLQECVGMLAGTVGQAGEGGGGGVDALPGLGFDIGGGLPLDLDAPDLFSLSDDLLSDKDFWLFQS